MERITLPAAVVHRDQFPYTPGVPVYYDFAEVRRLDTDPCGALVRAAIACPVTINVPRGGPVERKLRQLGLIVEDPEALEDRLAGPRELRLLL